MYKLKLIDNHDCVVFSNYYDNPIDILPDVKESFVKTILGRGGHLQLSYYGDLERPDSKIDGFI